jgi:uncharacterized protein (DUF2147 family)
MFCRFRGIGSEKVVFALRFIVMRNTNGSRTSCGLRGLVTAVAGAMLCCAPASADPREAGVWYDDSGNGAVKIEICTPTTLCGKIYWLKEPMNAQGTPKTDRYNPEPGLRTRPICGLPVLGELEQLSDGGFDNGWVYDPKEGKSYSVALDLIAPDKLKVTGYKGMKFLGKSFIWTRAPDDLPSCSSDAATAPTPATPKTKKAASINAAPAAKAKAGKTASTPKKGATPQHPVASN